MGPKTRSSVYIYIYERERERESIHIYVYIYMYLRGAVYFWGMGGGGGHMHPQRLTSGVVTLVQAIGSPKATPLRQTEYIERGLEA